jgi:hypothetical protein
MSPFATTAALEGWLRGSPYADQLPTDANDTLRLLTRASEVIADHTTGMYTVDAVTGNPPTAVQAVLSDAVCAQVEYWFEVGEEADLAGYEGSDLAPRAARLLRLSSLIRPLSGPAAPVTVVLT